jgi:short-subunit dehydrogenase
MATTLDDRHVLVLGATGGLGSAICTELAAAGARLTLSARTPDRLDALAERLGTAAVDRQPADLRDPDAPRRVVEAAAGQGGLDGVVNAAGVVAFGRIDELDDDVLDELMLLNLIAPIRLARAALPRLDRGGFLVNISAVVAEHPTAGMAAYSASEGGLTAFDTAARLEGRRRGVRVLDVRPPRTETGLAERPIAGAAPALGRGLDPEAVAARVVAAIRVERPQLSSTDFS